MTIARCEPARRRSRPVRALLLAMAMGFAQAGLAQSDDDDTRDAAADQRRNERLRSPGADAGTTQADTTTEGERTDRGTTRLDAVKDGAYALELVGPKRVRDLLARHLDLARFRTQTDIAPIELARLMSTTPAEVRALLEPEGWFESKTDVRRVPASDGGVPTVHVEVDPGPPVLVGKLDFQLRGPWSDAMNAQDDDGQRLARRWARLQRNWSLGSGKVFTQNGWTDAKNAMLIASRARGYANARYGETAADIDVPRRRADLSLTVESGPLYRIGQVRVEGLQHTPESAAQNLRPFELGSVYTEGALLDYQEALQKVGLYEGIAVELDMDSPDPANATVIARLREAQAQNATFSVGFSSNTGPRVGVEHVHRRFLDRDLVASTKLKIGRDERTASFDLLTYPKEGGVRDLVGASYEYLDAGGALTATERLRIGRQRETQRIDRLVTFEYVQTRLETLTRNGTDRALWGNVQWSHRDVNNLSFPTRGLIVGAQAGGGGARDSDGDTGPFARLQLGATWYQPLFAGWLGQLRGEAAQVLKKDNQGVPDALLFRAGGDDSVRGYGYRTLGPLQDGTVVGGAVLATGSVELMHRFTDARDSRWRDWYYAAFVDAGNAANNWHGIDPALGYGLGVRWRSPIGPLRVDVAYGERVQSFRLHVSVGVSFR